MNHPELTTYHYTVLRIVPHVHRAAFSNIGVILHARVSEYLGMRVITDVEVLRSLAPNVDVDLLVRYLTAHQAICRGDPEAGPIGALPPSERFHWLSAPRSDLLQASPVHEGLCEDPAMAL